MNKLIAMWCCVMLVSSPMALAQDKGAAKKAPMTQKELADKKQAIVKQPGMCAQKSQQNNLKPGSKEHHQFMNQCLHEKK